MRVVDVGLVGPVDQMTILTQGPLRLQPARPMQSVDDLGEQAFAILAVAG